MLFADINLSTEAAVAIGILLTALTGAVGGLFKLLMSSKDAQITEMTSRCASYKEMADEAINNLEQVAVTSGRKRSPRIAPVVPEHSSPATAKQLETAAMQTARARLVAATLDPGLPARIADGTP